MVKYMVSEKGSGKTKTLIDMTNKKSKESDGTVVYVSSTSKHIYDIHYSIRFIEISSDDLSTIDEFKGFLCGVIAQDNDLEEIFVDGLGKIIKHLDDEDLVALNDKLEALASKNKLQFTLGLNGNEDDVPSCLLGKLI